MATLPAELDDDARLPTSFGSSVARSNVLSGEFISGFSSLPIVRQLGLLIGLAASIALGLSAVLWLREPDYQPVTGSWSTYDMRQVSELMQTQGIPFKVDPGTGTMLVPSAQVAKARIALASADLIGEHINSATAAEDSTIVR